MVSKKHFYVMSQVQNQNLKKHKKHWKTYIHLLRFWIWILHMDFFLTSFHYKYFQSKVPYFGNIYNERKSKKNPCVKFKFKISISGCTFFSVFCVFLNFDFVLDSWHKNVFLRPFFIKKQNYHIHRGNT